jgi:hypothetical protein
MKKKNTENIMWGLFLIIAAATLIANAVYDFMGVWKLMIFIAIVLVVVLTIRFKQYSSLFIPLAVAGIIFAEPLGIQAVTPWPLLGAAVLITIAASLIFPNQWAGYHRINTAEALESIENGDTDCAVKFGASTRYFTNENLEKAVLKCDFGNLIAYFDEAKLNPEGATLYISANFSGLELYIPKHWNVQNNMSVILGGVEEKGKNIPAPDSPTLTIVGKASFSGIEIRYV